MNEKAIKKYNHVNVLTPMVYAFNLSGCRLLTFAYIHGFCRDESSVCYSSLTRIAETIGYARRTVEESIKNLRADGYIYKVGTTTIGGQEVNGYRTYFYELMDRYDAGEDIRPSKLKARRSSPKRGRAQSSLPNILPEGREQNSAEVGNIVREGREQCAPNNIMIYINKDYSSYKPQSRQEEEKLFKIIFLFRNAADPAAEVGKFVSWNEARGWQTRDGAKYDTVAKRSSLAEYGWDCKTGQRLPQGDTTDKYYKFLKEMLRVSMDRGGIDPEQLLSTSIRYRVASNGTFVWQCTPEVKRWFKENPMEQMLDIIDKTIALPLAFEQ